AVFATGARERLPQPVVEALIDGLVLGLVLDEDEPGVGLAPAVFDGSWLEEARRSIPPMGR
ncbi:MAG: hypothetical protein SFW67_12840, partial [Myxococcaceae bacterium]|nr:hypothetical protein [Myxococcaceae bacterium]